MGDQQEMREWVRGLGTPPQGWIRYILGNIILGFLLNVLWP